MNNKGFNFSQIKHYDSQFYSSIPLNFSNLVQSHEVLLVLQKEDFIGEKQLNLFKEKQQSWQISIHSPLSTFSAMAICCGTQLSAREKEERFHYQASLHKKEKQLMEQIYTNKH